MTITPKEKAKEVVDKYLQQLKTATPDLNRPYHQSKQCALICVNEILELEFNITCDAQERCVNKVLEYYQQVKQEIEKL